MEDRKGKNDQNLDVKDTWFEERNIMKGYFSGKFRQKFKQKISIKLLTANFSWCIISRPPFLYRWQYSSNIMLWTYSRHLLTENSDLIQKKSQKIKRNNNIWQYFHHQIFSIFILLISIFNITESSKFI